MVMGGTYLFCIATLAAYVVIDWQIIPGNPTNFNQ
tara:strand:- start:577 stop:681 length:105 start_codon:yes stop_codon:yes gene_type:complete